MSVCVCVCVCDRQHCASMPRIWVSGVWVDACVCRVYVCACACELCVHGM